MCFGMCVLVNAEEFMYALLWSKSLVSVFCREISKPGQCPKALEKVGTFEKKAGTLTKKWWDSNLAGKNQFSIIPDHIVAINKQYEQTEVHINILGFHFSLFSLRMGQGFCGRIVCRSIFRSKHIYLYQLKCMAKIGIVPL